MTSKKVKATERLSLYVSLLKFTDLRLISGSPTSQVKPNNHNREQERDSSTCMCTRSSAKITYNRTKKNLKPTYVYTQM